MGARRRVVPGHGAQADYQCGAAGESVQVAGRGGPEGQEGGGVAEEEEDCVECLHFVRWVGVNMDWEGGGWCVAFPTKKGDGMPCRLLILGGWLCVSYGGSKAGLGLIWKLLVAWDLQLLSVIFGRLSDGRTAGRKAGNIKGRVGTCRCVCAWVSGKQPGRLEGSGGGVGSGF